MSIMGMATTRFKRAEPARHAPTHSAYTQAEIENLLKEDFRELLQKRTDRITCFRVAILSDDSKRERGICRSQSIKVSRIVTLIEKPEQIDTLKRAFNAIQKDKEFARITKISQIDKCFDAPRQDGSPSITFVVSVVEA